MNPSFMKFREWPELLNRLFIAIFFSSCCAMFASYIHDARQRRALIRGFCRSYEWANKRLGIVLLQTLGKSWLTSPLEWEACFFNGSFLLIFITLRLLYNFVYNILIQFALFGNWILSEVNEFLLCLCQMKSEAFPRNSLTCLTAELMIKPSGHGFSPCLFSRGFLKKVIPSCYST